ncbi:MAG: ImmA/IrrE family metallo-endopeptidase [Butyricicoccaceae bacterium]
MPLNTRRAYTRVIERNRYIFIKQDLHPVMHNIVLLHEIGHDQLHRSAAIAAGGFQEFNLFNMADRAMEYEANMFAAQSRAARRGNPRVYHARLRRSRRSHS